MTYISSHYKLLVHIPKRQTTTSSTKHGRPLLRHQTSRATTLMRSVSQLQLDASAVPVDHSKCITAATDSELPMVIMRAVREVATSVFPQPRYTAGQLTASHRSCWARARDSGMH